MHANTATVITPAIHDDSPRQPEPPAVHVPPQAAGSEVCPYCAGKHEWSDCPVVYTPITDCEYKDAEDGCCSHPKNMTPECHVGACPRLNRKLTKQLDAASGITAVRDCWRCHSSTAEEPWCSHCGADKPWGSGPQNTEVTGAPRPVE